MYKHTLVTQLRKFEYFYIIDFLNYGATLFFLGKEI